MLQENLVTIAGIVLTLTDLSFLLEEIHSLCPQHFQACRDLGSLTAIGHIRVCVTVFPVTLLCVGSFFSVMSNPSMSEGPLFLLGNGPFRQHEAGTTSSLAIMCRRDRSLNKTKSTMPYLKIIFLSHRNHLRLISLTSVSAGLMFSGYSVTESSFLPLIQVS